MLTVLSIGFALGYVGSMPVAGPIAALVFWRGLEDRGRNALCLALGAAIAESFYAYAAFWGFSAVLVRYAWIERAAHLCAALVFIALGAHFYQKRQTLVPARPQDASPPQARGDKRNFLLGFVITALNPTLIATWTFAVTTLYSFNVARFEPSNALPFSLGALVGIVAWFATLLRLMARFRPQIERLNVQRVLNVMGIVMMVSGLVLGLSASRVYFTSTSAQSPLRGATSQVQRDALGVHD
jgi:threonine/homoserine/homoserine lactone efflux protein